MFPRSRFIPLLLLLVLCFISIAQAQSAVPRIFYSDLQSGPATGGQSSQGAFVTVYGKGFGATRGSSSVKVGSTPAYGYPVWTDTQISFQISNATALGNTNIVVTVGGIASNAVPFAVRTGRIYFVSPTGRDSQKGTYNRPWRTLAKAVRAMAAGDTVYAMGNLAEGASSTAAASLSIARAGNAGLPFALVKYPGASAAIGSATGPSYGVQALNGGFRYWVIAGLTIRGALGGVDLTGATDWRLVGNDISCPNGYGAGGCVRATSSPRLSMLGNRVHDSGSTSSSDVRSFDSVEISASSDIDIGWNKITDTRSCRALRVTSSGAAVYGITIHDNYIQNSVCDGISLASLDPSLGSVQVYNNIVERAGTGPAPGGVESTYACIAAAGNGAGAVDIHHNTLRDCGARANSDSGAILASTTVSVVNNIVSLGAGQNYITPNTSNGWLTGSNNLFYGAGAVPAALAESINTDPKFVDPANHNLRLQATSPAIDSGMVCALKKDMDGAPRPQGASDDLGAFEFTGTAAVARLSFSQPSLSFGSVTVGSSDTQTVSLTNTGTVNLTVTQMNVTGTAFSVSGAMLPVTLSAGQSVSFNVKFAPTTPGGASGSITPTTTVPVTVAALQLSGSGVAAIGSLTASTSSLSFGNITMGSNASKSVVVTANSASVTISQASITGAGYSVTGPTLPLTLSAGQSAAFTVKFAPSTVGPASGSLIITSDASDSPINVAATGAGVAPSGTLTSDATSLGFGNITLGSSNSMPLTFTASNASVIISQASIAGSGFTLTGPALPLTLAVGQSASFMVKFTPTVSGPVTGTLTIFSDANNSPSNVAVSGTGVAPVGMLAADKASLNFANLTVGSSVSLPVIFTASTASVTISQATINGSGFTFTGITLPMTLAAGQSVTLMVKFAPTAAGTFTGSLSVLSNASGSPIVVSLSGAATMPIAHSVTLNWIASTSSGVVGYSVYRGTASGGPYTKVGSLVTGTTFMDSNVVAGATYYYCVTAVGATGQESVYSAVAAATIPTP
jgi:hypothetical protein